MLDVVPAPLCHLIMQKTEKKDDELKVAVPMRLMLPVMVRLRSGDE